MSTAPDASSLIDVGGTAARNERDVKAFITEEALRFGDVHRPLGRARAEDAEVHFGERPGRVCRA